MDAESWIRADGRRRLAYAGSRILGDSEYRAELIALPDGRVLRSLESTKLSVVPGRSGLVFYALDTGRPSIRSTETGDVQCEIQANVSAFGTTNVDVLVAVLDDDDFRPDRVLVASAVSGEVLRRRPGETGTLSSDGRLAVTATPDQVLVEDLDYVAVGREYQRRSTYGAFSVCDGRSLGPVDEASRPREHARGITLRAQVWPRARRSSPRAGRGGRA